MFIRHVRFLSAFAKHHATWCHAALWLNEYFSCRAIDLIDLYSKQLQQHLDVRDWDRENRHEHRNHEHLNPYRHRVRRRVFVKWMFLLKWNSVHCVVLWNENKYVRSRSVAVTADRPLLLTTVLFYGLSEKGKRRRDTFFQAGRNTKKVAGCERSPAAIKYRGTWY